MKYIFAILFKKSGIILTIILFAAILAVGCKKKNDDDSAKQQDTCGTLSMSYLVDGNQLHYLYTIFLAGVINIDITIKNFGTNNDFIYLSSISGGQADTTYAKECNGWFYTNSNYPLINTNKTAKPINSLGDSWTNINSIDTTTYTVIAKNVNITVPAGIFICDQITFNSFIKPQIDTLYFNNTVGIVKVVGTSFTQTLNSKNF